MSQTNNNTEIKEQDTQDEIIWEGKKDILSFLLYWITYVGGKIKFPFGKIKLP
ncbi:hypothetical protein ACVPEX_000153 [Campylobacter coli]